jgi:hypothetical protein
VLVFSSIGEDDDEDDDDFSLPLSLKGDKGELELDEGRSIL